MHLSIKRNEQNGAIKIHDGMIFIFNMYPGLLHNNMYLCIWFVSLYRGCG